MPLVPAKEKWKRGKKVSPVNHRLLSVTLKGRTVATSWFSLYGQQISPLYCTITRSCNQENTQTFFFSTLLFLLKRKWIPSLKGHFGVGEMGKVFPRVPQGIAVRPPNMHGTLNPVSGLLAPYADSSSICEEALKAGLGLIRKRICRRQLSSRL